ncbi:hypothetical protein BKA64DRAFT_639231 [Cadophora sp. MPI-SDFR-AT-0126]|nr:hypothetical protein BKA64DRAFT_639231 [Leotiomycetes sp. MPI-SDFR-AT-0126]
MAKPSELMFIVDEYKHLYGLHILSIIAISNPTCLHKDPADDSTFPSTKDVPVISDPDFTKFYENKLHDKVVDLIFNVFPQSQRWALGAFRVGRSPVPTNNPIVIFVIIDEDASMGLKDSDKEKSTSGHPTAKPFSPMHSKLCDQSIAPFPGYSMGPKGKDFRAGSFTCFIKHKDEIYGLGNEHTINGSSENTISGAPAELLLPNSPYKNDGKGKKYIVTMPAVKDHEESLKDIQDRLNSCIENTKQGKAWDINVGHVIATSDQDQLHQFNGYGGRLDWCIFTCQTLQQISEFPAYSAHDSGSGFQLHNVRVKNHLRAEGFLIHAISSAQSSRPVTQPRTELPVEDEMLFKASSRTTPLCEAVCAGIKSTVYNKASGRAPTREFCVVTQDMLHASSDYGDSGAMLFDKEFRPLAMVWGGDGGNLPDVTYATPLSVVFRHIEHIMGWESGSVILNRAVDNDLLRETRTS